MNAATTKSNETRKQTMTDNDIRTDSLWRRVCRIAAVDAEIVNLAATSDSLDAFAAAMKEPISRILLSIIETDRKWAAQLRSDPKLRSLAVDYVLRRVHADINSERGR